MTEGRGSDVAVDGMRIDPSVWDLIVRRAALTPDAPMLIDERDRALTFGDYAAAVEVAAAGLAGLGVMAGSTVGWQLPTSLEAAVLMGALARLSAVQVALLPVLRRREVSFILSQTDAQFFVVPTVVRGFDHGALAKEMADEFGLRAVVLNDVASSEFGLCLPSGERSMLQAATRPDPAETHWVYYTSGSTADPKGVRHRDGSILNSANTLVATARLGPHDVLCAPIPFTHIGGIMFIVASLRTGCRLVLLEAFDAVATPQLAARHDASVVGAVPVMMPAFFDAQRAQPDTALLPRLRYLLSGGAPVPPALHEQVKRELGGIGAVSPWGLTEAPQLTFPPLDGTDEQLAGTVGIPAPWVEIRVVDGEGRRCPPGVEGELRVRGPQVFVGYVDSTLDADAFDESGFMRTGDLGTIDAHGFVRVTGRLKDVIIRNGENLSVLEIEYTLLTHAAVADAAVIGVPDERTGERCCAFVVLAPDVQTLSLAEVRAHVDAQGLARHKSPEQIEIVEEIPRNLLGKIQKHELRRLLGVQK